MSIGAVADGFQKEMFQCISPGTSQALAVGGSSVQSALPQTGVTIVRLFSTADCFVAFGSNPTAVVEGASSMFLPAGIVEYFEIRIDEKLAVISATALTGKLYVTEGGAA